MPTYFISGHLSLTWAEFVEHYKEEIDQALADPEGKFVIGDAPGADTLAQEYLTSTGAEVTVFHMFDSPRHLASRLFSTQGGFQTDEERDEAMTRASAADIAWVRPGRETSGTARNLVRRHAVNDGVQFLKVPYVPDPERQARAAEIVEKVFKGS